MTIQIRKADDRGKADYGWLKTSYSFSFSEYYDARFMGFGPLRVINDDYIAGGGGFPTHPHRDMEIITYVLEGALEHKDSLGNGSIIKAGDIQYMCAGTGIRHSEFNPHPSETCHLLQIWVMPDKVGYTPSYGQANFAPEEKRGKLRLIASQNGDDGSVKVHQKLNLYAAVFDENDTITHKIENGHGVWLQMAKGGLFLNEIELKEGDGVAIWEENEISLKANGESEFLLFDMG